jgi:hypothetical protein
MTDLDDLEAKVRAAVLAIAKPDGSMTLVERDRAAYQFRLATTPAAVLDLVQRVRAAEGRCFQSDVRAAARARACPMCGFVWSEPGPCPTCSKRLATAEAIVRDLAEHDPDTYEEWIDAINGSGRWCPLCKAAYTEGPGEDLYTPMPLEAHSAQCMHRRAVEATR